jgi:hypothetical protein
LGGRLFRDEKPYAPWAVLCHGQEINMASYPQLRALVAGIRPASSDVSFRRVVVPYLVDVWVRDYRSRSHPSEIVETSAAQFSYLFDITAARLLAAWGLSRGRHGGPRDASRMAGHPLSAGQQYHRGHAIPHTLGGPTDINLVPQRGSVNIGPFRALEKRAVATPGALYFTYWIYTSRTSQIPARVDQGLLIPGAAPEITTHPLSRGAHREGESPAC